MARPIWKGSISFGLVNIPIVLYSAEQRSDLHFKLLDSRDRARVRYERINEVTGKEVPWDQIVRGFEYDDGNYVLMTDEDFKKAAVEATQTIDIENFVAGGAVDWAYIDKPYYLEPGKRGEKGFVLLRETLKRTEQVAIAKVVIRSRQHLAAVAPRGDGLVLLLLRFHQELRDYDEFDLPRGDLKDYKVSDQEIKMAEQLVASMQSDWEPEKYEDEYRAQLMEWIEKKAGTEGAAPAETREEEAEPGDVVNIMDLLEKSVQSQKGKKSTAKKAKQTKKKKRA